jgi:hypothetical protein
MAVTRFKTTSAPPRRSVIRFKITSPPPRRLTVAQTAAKYGLSKAAAEQVARYINYHEPIRSKTASGTYVVRLRSKKKAVARKAR